MSLLLWVHSGHLSSIQIRLGLCWPFKCIIEVVLINPDSFNQSWFGQLFTNQILFSTKQVGAVFDSTSVLILFETLLPGWQHQGQLGGRRWGWCPPTAGRWHRARVETDAVETILVICRNYEGEFRGIARHNRPRRHRRRRRRRCRQRRCRRRGSSMHGRGGRSARVETEAVVVLAHKVDGWLSEAAVNWNEVDRWLLESGLPCAAYLELQN